MKSTYEIKELEIITKLQEMHQSTIAAICYVNNILCCKMIGFYT